MSGRRVPSRHFSHSVYRLFETRELKMAPIYAIYGNLKIVYRLNTDSGAAKYGKLSTPFAPVEQRQRACEAIREAMHGAQCDLPPRGSRHDAELDQDYRTVSAPPLHFPDVGRAGRSQH